MTKLHTKSKTSPHLNGSAKLKVKKRKHHEIIDEVKGSFVVNGSAKRSKTKKRKQNNVIGEVKESVVASKSAKRKKMKKRKHQEPTEEVEEAVPKLIRSSDEPPPKKVKWVNKQRVLVFGSRGISHRDRHLMEDLRTLMPHARAESKMERKENLFVVNEICEMKNCNKCVLFEGRLKRDLYLWISNIPNGPSAKFLIENVYTMGELKLNGNCLKGSRPLLSFDESFTKHPHFSVLKELFVQVFGTPNQHPKSQPFTDHVMTFTVLDNRIWFRNFQILSEDGALVEIGPRFVMNPVKIFEGSFGGETLWENPFYVTPSKHRQLLKKAAAGKYISRVEHKVALETTAPEETYRLNKMDEIFVGDSLERAKEIAMSSTQEQGQQKKKGKKKKKLKSKIHSKLQQKIKMKKKKMKKRSSGETPNEAE